MFRAFGWRCSQDHFCLFPFNLLILFGARNKVPGADSQFQGPTLLVPFTAVLLDVGGLWLCHTDVILADTLYFSAQSRVRWSPWSLPTLFSAPFPTSWSYPAFAQGACSPGARVPPHRQPHTSPLPSRWWNVHMGLRAPCPPRPCSEERIWF